LTTPHATSLRHVPFLQNGPLREGRSENNPNFN